MKFSKLACGTAIALMFSSVANADFRARVGFSDQSMDSVYSGGLVTADYSSTNYGLTYAFDNGYYLDYGTKLGEDTDTNLRGNYPGSEFSRDETTITLGKSLGDGLSVFGGITETEYSVPLGFTPIGAFTEHLDSDGLFIGVGKSILLDTGVLSLSFAYADLDMDLTYEGFNGTPISFTGDGFSYSAAYVYPVNDQIAVNFEYRNQEYNYTSAGNQLSGTLDQDDTVSQLGINLLYSF
jgi:hypothetical protein